MANVNIINGRARGQGKYLVLYADAACVFRIADSTWPVGVYQVPVYLQISGLGNELTITHDFDGNYFQIIDPIQDGPDCIPFYGAVSGQQNAIYITYPPGTVVAGGCTDTLANILTRSGPFNTTWDPATITNVTLSGGNLVAANTVAFSYNQGARVATGKTSGKYYFELAFTTLVDTSQPSQAQQLGVAMTTANYTAVGQVETDACTLNYQGNVGLNGVGQVGFGLRASGDKIGIALDLDAIPRRIWFRIAPSGNWNNSGTANPATNTGGINIAALTGALAPIATFGGDPGHGFVGNVETANFGATAFVGAAPAGFISGWPT